MTTKSNLERKIQELSSLYNISKALSASQLIAEVLDEIMAILGRDLGMNRGTVALLTRFGDEVRIEASYGLSPEAVSRGRYRLGEGVTGTVVETGEPMVVPSIGEDPLFLDRTKSRRNLTKEDVSFVCVPIKIGDEVVGALSADRLFTPDVAFDEDVRLLTIIASLIGHAVKIHRMVEDEKQGLVEEKERLQRDLVSKYNITNIVGNAKAMHQVYKMVNQVAQSNATVLIRGESGTGKELVAHAIHYNSPRARRPFVKVNCAAIPENLLESELFGHEKGAFTGAVSEKPGKFEHADGGTIFLDEIGDLSPPTQVKLLRVLQEKEFERVGGLKTLKSNVRVVAATNRELESLMEEGGFRDDLYYRLNVFPIFMPPLRERKTDILLLAEHFLSKYNEENGKEIRRISTPAIDMLMAYHWPGNVRELENCIERAVLVCGSPAIHAHHLPPTLQMGEGEESSSGLELSFDGAVRNFETDIIVDALKATRGNVRKAAEKMMTTQRIIGYKIKKYGIDPKRYK